MKKYMICLMICVLLGGYGIFVSTETQKSYNDGVDNCWAEAKNVNRIFIYRDNDIFIGFYNEEEMMDLNEFICKDHALEKYALKEGDIVELKGDISILWGVGTSCYIDKIDQLKVLSDDEVDEKKVPIIQRIEQGLSC